MVPPARARGGVTLALLRRVVDVGAGKGHLTAGLAALVGAPALAVDSDASLLRVGARLYPSVAFSCEAVGDAASLAAQLRAGDASAAAAAEVVRTVTFSILLLDFSC